MQHWARGTYVFHSPLKDISWRTGIDGERERRRGWDVSLSLSLARERKYIEERKVRRRSRLDWNICETYFAWLTRDILYRTADIQGADKLTVQPRNEWFRAEKYIGNAEEIVHAKGSRVCDGVYSQRDRRISEVWFWKLERGRTRNTQAENGCLHARACRHIKSGHAWPSAGSRVIKNFRPTGLSCNF